ncbi:hypothetical protein OS493_027071 [Desmophyllum pertusum]|uniref:ZU5 domain-containing protein n=1 Tax=Desmophyllum pertusum TaxID=174260 RepID=A0A9W9YCV2_9CNID|nr:hypothetical protein OS493_027071 [Desmophyllum pertusum]
MLLPSLELAEEAADSLTNTGGSNSSWLTETLSFDKSGVLLKFSDAQSFFDDAQGIRLEICWDKNFIKTLQHDEVQLSPVVKFHPNGFQLSKPAQVRIPHSALVFYSNGWQLKLKSSTLHGERIVWTDEDLYQVNNNEVSFQVNYLLSYVVVGASLCNNKPTRSVCSVLCLEERAELVWTIQPMYLFLMTARHHLRYLIDFLLKNHARREVKHRILLGSPQSLYVESVIKTDIKISVKQPVEGWIVGEIKPEFITHKSLKESYQNIPRAEILFKHDNGRNRDFLCIFELSAENTTTTICAVASIKEEVSGAPTKLGHDKHQMVTGRNLCDPLITSQEKSSPCLHKLPEEELHADQIQVFRNELLTPDGSPCTVMFEALKTKSPNLTVVEFVQILQTRKIQRFDVVDTLEAYVYDPIPNSNEA